jgi:import inner membrane translocase subunit TIM23
MSVWDVFTGRKSSKLSTETIASTPTTNFSSAPFDPASAQDVSSFLGSASLPDASQLHPLAGLNQQALDYLSLDESTLSDLPGSRSALPSRGWSDDLCYGTGVTYLTALSIGGAWGLIEGLNRAPASAPPKLRLNSVLNSVTRRGPFLGNSAGVVAMVYNGFNSIIGHYRGKHDSANSIVAGALSGMLFKSTRGLKPMVISGGIVATVAGTWAVRIMPIRFRWEMLTPTSGHQKSTLLSSKTYAKSIPASALSSEPGGDSLVPYDLNDNPANGRACNLFSSLPSFMY